MVHSLQENTLPYRFRGARRRDKRSSYSRGEPSKDHALNKGLGTFELPVLFLHVSGCNLFVTQRCSVSGQTLAGVHFAAVAVECIVATLRSFISVQHRESPQILPTGIEPRAEMLTDSPSPSVCPSVRLSVCLRPFLSVR